MKNYEKFVSVRIKSYQDVQNLYCRILGTEEAVFKLPGGVMYDASRKKDGLWLVRSDNFRGNMNTDEMVEFLKDQL